jgi:ribosomal protein S18 acetylase RimI-like enzyme
MDTFIIRSYQSEDEQEVIALWFACNLVVPVNNPQRDIARKLKVNPELFLVATLGGKVVGTCMAGYEGHRGWINYLAVSPDYRRQGIAARLMAAAEEKLKAFGCPKINLQVRKTNTQVIQFYERLGYKVDDVVGMGKRIE